jgi:leucyl-tRNA synthetase
MLSPIVPHISHALWQALGHSEAAIEQSWPVVDRHALEADQVEIVIQVNGKLRSRIAVAADSDNDAIGKRALADPNVQRFVGGKAIRKMIVVPGRLVNIVV